MIKAAYRLLSAYNDYRAIARGRYPQRLARRSIYAYTGKWARRIFKP